MRILKKTIVISGVLVATLFVGTTVLLKCSVVWVFDTWPNLEMDELIYHIMAPLEGTNSAVITEYINQCVVPTILMMLAMGIVLISLIRGNYYKLVIICSIVSSILVCGFQINNIWHRLGIGEYLLAQGTDSDFVENYYISPAEVDIIFPEEKRNLIYIYLESMETTFSDKENGGAYSKDIIPELTELAKNNEDFSGDEDIINGANSVYGTGWTIGAMFGQTAALPLTISIDGNSMDTQDSFFAGIYTLGDVLEQAGYNQSLMIGSEAVFGGRELYFTTHGNYKMYDYYWAIENKLIPEDYKVWWGYEDEKLFEYAKEKLEEISQNPEPFNFTILTVDTHAEDGYVCSKCQNEYEEQYANVLSCSSHLLERFVEWIQQQSFYENTTVVVVGDHLTMDSDFCDVVDKDYERKVYTSYINSVAEPVTNYKRNYSVFDLFPTTLASLGVMIEGERLGLGTNLFSAEQTLVERLGIAKINSELMKKSAFIEMIADLNPNKEELLKRTGKLPKALAWVGSYNFQTGLLPVVVEEITDTNEDIVNMYIAVWTNEDQSDITWISMETIEDGKYLANIYVPDFGYKTGNYYVDLYGVGESGIEYKLGKLVGYVE